MVPPGDRKFENRLVKSGGGVFGNNFVKIVVRRLRMGVKKNVAKGVRIVRRGEKRKMGEKVDEGQVRV